MKDTSHEASDGRVSPLRYPRTNPSLPYPASMHRRDLVPTRETFAHAWVVGTPEPDGPHPRPVLTTLLARAGAPRARRLPQKVMQAAIADAMRDQHALARADAFEDGHVPLDLAPLPEAVLHALAPATRFQERLGTAADRLNTDRDPIFIAHHSTAVLDRIVRQQLQIHHHESALRRRIAAERQITDGMAIAQALHQRPVQV